MEILIQKLLLLVAMLSALLNPNPKLGVITVETIKSDVVSDVASIQNTEFNKTGKYKYIPITEISSTTSYKVDEFQFADGSKDYQIILYTYKNVKTWNATTSKYEIIKILNSEIIK